MSDSLFNYFFCYSSFDIHQFIIKVKGKGYVKSNKLGGTIEPSLYRETRMRWCVEHHVGQKEVR